MSLFIFLLLIPSLLFGEVCYKCHPRKKFQGSFIHAPIKKKGCYTCHNPHVSRYKALLKEKTPDICYSCHKKIERKIKTHFYIHKPVKESNCFSCHKPHSSSYAHLLKEKIPDLCFSCHKSMEEYTKEHDPFKKGHCLICHDPHASKDYNLTKVEDPDACLSCHKDTKESREKHYGYSLRKIKCLGCHNPHGGEKGFVRRYIHNPFKKDCDTCHKSREKGPELCFRCHEDIRGKFYTNHSHLLGGQKNSCLNCHNAHASSEKSLISGKQKHLCLTCHKYTYLKREKYLYAHPKWDRCTDCHDPHGSSRLAMMYKDGNQLCAKCHETQGKFTHPIGPRVRDPRNGQEITCVTCHDPMGADFKYELKLSGERELCIQCHKSY